MFILYFTHARHLFLAFPPTQEEKNKQYILNLTISQKNMVVNTLIQINYEVQVNWTFSGNLSATDLICFLFFYNQGCVDGFAERGGQTCERKE